MTWNGIGAGLGRWARGWRCVVDELLQELLDLGQFAERTELSKLGDELAWIEWVDRALSFELRCQQRQKRGGQVLPGIAGV